MNKRRPQQPKAPPMTASDYFGAGCGIAALIVLAWPVFLLVVFTLGIEDAIPEALWNVLGFILLAAMIAMPVLAVLGVLTTAIYEEPSSKERYRDQERGPMDWGDRDD